MEHIEPICSLESKLQGCWANPDDGNRQKAVRITPTRPDYSNTKAVDVS